jgi:hypothetical protein
MSILKKIRRWCPQPKTPVATNFTRMSAPIIGGVLLVEFIFLLIIPIAYCALLVPKQIVAAPDQTLPLTNSQIEAAWPNLPTAQEVVNGGKGYSSIDSSMAGFDQVKNYTWISPVNAIPRTYPSGVLVTRLVPVEYFIWLKLNDTTWVSVDPPYLATNNPPYSLPSPAYWTEQVGFLGTGLPTQYFIVATAALLTTLAIGAGYLLRKKQLSKFVGEKK